MKDVNVGLFFVFLMTHCIGGMYPGSWVTVGPCVAQASVASLPGEHVCVWPPLTTHGFACRAPKVEPQCQQLWQVQSTVQADI